MATVTKFASANTVVTTGWTNPTNAYADDGVYATSAPAKNASVTTDFGFAAFTTTDIPAGSTITSVTLELQYKADGTTSSGAVIGYQGYNGALVGAEVTQALVTVDTTQTIVVAGVVLADLATANKVRLRVRGNRSSSNNAVTWSLDYVKVTVVYSTGQTVPVSGVASAQLFGKLRQSRIVPSVYPSGQIPSIVNSFVVDDGHVVNGTLSPSQFGTLTVRFTIPPVIAGGVPSAGLFGVVTVKATIGKPTGGVPSAQSFGAVATKATITRTVSGLGSAQSFGATAYLQLVQVKGLWPNGFVPSITGGVISGDGHRVGGSAAAQFGVVHAGIATVSIPVNGVPSASNFGHVTIHGGIVTPSGGVPSAQAFGTLTIPVLIPVPGLGSAQAFGALDAFVSYLHPLDCLFDGVLPICGEAICGQAICGGTSAFSEPLDETDLDLDDLDCLQDGTIPICGEVLCGTALCGGKAAYSHPLDETTLDLEPAGCT